MLLLVVLPGLNNFSYRGVSDDAEHVQRAIQLAHERELIGTDHIRLTASGNLRSGNQVREFVADYVARSMKPGLKSRSREIANAIMKSGVRHGLDPLLLLAVIENESRFNPNIIGSHGEIGLMQIKPDTAEWIAKKERIRWKGGESLYDPLVNIRIGAGYLAMLRSKFGFDKNLYLAAYNMGVTKLYRMLGDKIHPQEYTQKTLEHYSKIYGEFMNQKNMVKVARNEGAIAI